MCATSATKSANAALWSPALKPPTVGSLGQPLARCKSGAQATAGRTSSASPAPPPSAGRRQRLQATLRQ
eukprot:15471957-Alexandrium_andersonii.AAC.1